MRHSVRVKLTLWNMGILALVLLVFSLAAALIIRAQLFASVDVQLSRNARRLSRLMSMHPPGERNMPRFFRHPHRPGPENILAPRVANLQGHVMEPPGEANLWDPKAFALAIHGHQVFSQIEQAGDSYRVISAPIIQEGHVMAVVQLAYPLHNLQRLLDDVTRTLLIIIPLALIVAGLGGMFLTTRSLRPVRQVEQVAREITAHDLSRRIEVTGDDEFSRLASTFNNMIGRLERSFEAQRQFVADASHELRTPLSTVKGSTTLALSDTRTNLEYRHALEIADRAADRMNKIVEDLLFLAWSDSGEMQLEMQPLAVADILSCAKDAFVGQVTPVIKIELAEPSFRVNGDLESLVRVFVNLLTNAVRHTPDSGLIRLSAVREKEWIAILVTDTGEGIPEEHLDRLGERFYRVDAARSRLRGGTGLGLAICTSILSSHAGSMDIKSKVGEGTTATVRLRRINV